MPGHLHGHEGGYTFGTARLAKAPTQSKWRALQSTTLSWTQARASCMPQPLFPCPLPYPPRRAARQVVAHREPLGVARVAAHFGTCARNAPRPPVPSPGPSTETPCHRLSWDRQDCSPECKVCLCTEREPAGGLWPLKPLQEEGAGRGLPQRPRPKLKSRRSEAPPGAIDPRSGGGA